MIWSFVKGRKRNLTDTDVMVHNDRKFEGASEIAIGFGLKAFTSYLACMQQILLAERLVAISVLARTVIMM